MPTAHALEKTIGPAVSILGHEPSAIRPLDSGKRPGGILFLDPDIVTVIIPDLHGRMELLPQFLHLQVPGPKETSIPFQVGKQKPLIQALHEKEAQILFLGDYVHAERRAMNRWHIALQEFLEGYSRHVAMDQEMKENLGTLEMLAILKTYFPDAVHFLKGNHENICDREGNGNHPLGKFAYEGQMVTNFITKFYPPETLQLLDSFESELPILAVGQNFLASHAEPMRMYAKEEVINFRDNPQTIEGLTWTANDEAEPNAVASMLQEYSNELPWDDEIQKFYFGGHRPIEGTYNLRANGKYIQLHNPNSGIAAIVSPARQFLPDEDIYMI